VFSINKLMKLFIYWIDKVFLKRSISKLVNYFLLRDKIKLIANLATGQYAVYNFKKLNSLEKLADKYKTDKGGYFHKNKGIRRPHSYTTFYDELFSHSRLQIRKVFECGIGTNNENISSNMSSDGTPGASLRMWRDYFENALIVGGDIDKDILFSETRIKCFHLDQTDDLSVKNFWNSVDLDEFDLMIDDGLHNLWAAQTLFNGSYKFLKQGGVYVIEDISPWQIEDYILWLDKLGVSYSIVTLFYLENIISDDILIVITK